jgi:hypothetical protein
LPFRAAGSSIRALACARKEDDMTIQGLAGATIWSEDLNKNL